ncbi:MAG: hypothetical protein M0Z48_10395 [Nitrospiraceae bacterium]|nr:hypothetical protein [Nitrospiraceae bacterium]
MKAMKAVKTATYLSLALLLLPFCGCSDFCRASAYSGFLPGDAVCLPHTIISAVHLGKDIHNDMKPGGMLNPHGKAGISNTPVPAANMAISNAGSPALLSASSSLINTPTLEIKK